MDTSMAEAQPANNTNGSSQQDSGDKSIQKANALASSLFQNANVKIIARAIEQTMKELDESLPKLLESCWESSPELRPAMKNCLQAIRAQNTLSNFQMAPPSFVPPL